MYNAMTTCLYYGNLKFDNFHAIVFVINYALVDFHVSTDTWVQN